MNALADSLWLAALALENDSRFCREYRESGADFSGRRAGIMQAINRLKIAYGGEDYTKAYCTDQEFREQLRRYFDDTLNAAVDYGCSPNANWKLPTIEFWKDSVRFPDRTPPKSEVTQLSQPPKEITMTKTAIKITTKTFANGVDLSTMSDSEVFDMIAAQEAEIKKLQSIETKPNRLVAEIADRQAGIFALVAHLDSNPAK